MSDLLTQILLFMACTFVFGLILGWLIWGMEYAKKMKLMSSEANFWKDNLEKNRQEHQKDLMKIEALLGEQANLKKRLAAKKSS